jgi:hypothetical protein
MCLAVWCKPERFLRRQSRMGEKDTTGGPLQHPAEEPGSGDVPPPGATQIADRRRGRPRWGLIASAIAGLCVLTAGIVLAVVSQPGGSVDHSIAGAALSATPQPTAPAPSEHATPGHATSGRHHGASREGATSTPKVASDGIASSALRFPKSRTKQVLRWKAGSGGKALTAVVTQMGYALHAAGARLYPEMKLACVRLASDIQAARAEPPIPDASMQRLYGQALAQLSQAAGDCRSAISVQPGNEAVETHLHNALLNRSRTELATGSKTLYDATAAIRAL